MRQMYTLFCKIPYGQHLIIIVQLKNSPELVRPDEKISKIQLAQIKNQLITDYFPKTSTFQSRKESLKSTCP